MNEMPRFILHLSSFNNTLIDWIFV